MEISDPPPYFLSTQIHFKVKNSLNFLNILGFAIASLFIDPNEESHLVPDVEVTKKSVFFVCR